MVVIGAEVKKDQIMKNNIVIRIEEKSEYREVENLVRDSFWNVYRPGCLEHMKKSDIRIWLFRIMEYLIFGEYEISQGLGAPFLQVFQAESYAAVVTDAMGCSKVFRIIL